MEGIRKHDTAFEPFMKELGLDPAKMCRRSLILAIANTSKRSSSTATIHWKTPAWIFGGWIGTRMATCRCQASALRHMPWLNQLYFQQSQRKGFARSELQPVGGWGDHRHPIHFSGDAGDELGVAGVSNSVYIDRRQRRVFFLEPRHRRAHGRAKRRELRAVVSVRRAQCCVRRTAPEMKRWTAGRGNMRNGRRIRCESRSGCAASCSRTFIQAWRKVAASRSR